ncbi:hypothetical protein KKC87_00335 [Patescibacteria group bacterium]|nr:hypothetical protein [Patescibacteria group bacterium]
MKYATAKASQNAQAQRQQRMGAGFDPTAAGRTQRTGGRAGGGFVSGEIIGRDDKSLTLKLTDGGSKIVFFADSTEIGIFEKGEIADLENGKAVTVSGSPNEDGSVIAQSIQIRPLGMMTPSTSTR